MPILIDKVFSFLIENKLIDYNPTINERIDQAVLVRDAREAEEAINSEDEYDSSDYESDD